MINNYGNYGNGSASLGFTVDFTGSTAIFNNTARQELTSADAMHNDNMTLTVKTSADVLYS